MALFGFGKKNEEEKPACTCSCGCSCEPSAVPSHLGPITKVRVLGSGCKNCHTLLESTQEAVRTLGLPVQVEYVTDMQEIMASGAMMMPALEINGRIASGGRVLKASAHSAIALLLTDPGSRIAVFSQESRAPGILAGQGTGQPLEVNFVQRATRVNAGEILITSGLDGKYPKGIPVARVLSVAPSDYTQFMAIKAEPLVDLHHLEEVLLLEPTGVAPPPDLGAPPKEIHGPPTPGRPAP